MKIFSWWMFLWTQKKTLFKFKHWCLQPVVGMLLGGVVSVSRTAGPILWAASAWPALRQRWSNISILQPESLAHLGQASVFTPLFKVLTSTEPISLCSKRVWILKIRNLLRIFYLCLWRQATADWDFSFFKYHFKIPVHLTYSTLISGVQYCDPTIPYVTQCSSRQVYS